MVLTGNSDYVEVKKFFLDCLKLEDKDRTFVGTSGNYSTDNTGSHPRKPPSSVPSKFALLFYAHTTHIFYNTVIAITEVYIFFFLHF